MHPDLQETRLPGIGWKFTLRLDGGGRLAVIQHNDGRRDVYWFRHAGDDEPQAVIELHDDEARQFGAVLGGAYERSKIVEDLEVALGELNIEWVAVPDGSPCIGQTLADCGFRARTGVTVIAILREPVPVSGAQPDDVVLRGDTLVTVGKAGQYREFRELLSRLRRARATSRTALVISSPVNGLATRDRATVERVAWSSTPCEVAGRVDDGRIPMAAGAQLVDQFRCRSGPA